MTETVGLGFEPTDLAADDDNVWVVGGFDHGSGASTGTGCRG